MNSSGPGHWQVGTDAPTGTLAPSVAELLSQLQASPTFSIASSGAPSPSSPTTPSPSERTSLDVPTSPSVADLLSKLQTPLASPQAQVSSNQGISTSSHLASTSHTIAHAQRDVATPTHKSAQDMKSLTFQQALPHLARLSENLEFVSAMAEMKRQQAKLERQLWEERQAIQKKYEAKVKTAQTKANIIGSGLSKHEAAMMSDAFRRELQRFDLERVLPAWDGLITKQQLALHELGVPIMFVTNSKSDVEKQQRLIKVLEGILEW